MVEETHVNFLGGSPLNRLSWLRSSTPFLNAVLASKETKWILFQNGQPLVSARGSVKTRSLAKLSTPEIKRFLGPEPVFGQGKEPGDAVEEGVFSPALEASRLHGPAVVFLGLHEPEGVEVKSALPSSDFSAKTDPKLAAANIQGTPYFALDVSDTDEETIKSITSVTASTGPDDLTYEFAEPRSASGTFSMFEAAVFAEARSMIDWNSRNKFCPGCGSPTYSVWAGWKLSCSTLLPWADNTGRKPCPSTKGVHNFSHPRTDPVVIMAVIDESGDKILLGRNRRFPGGFYSTLAGFMEPGESFEDAVKREIWEEAGVRVWGVKYHSGQPWPYPANLMVGFYAFADSTQPVRVDLDNELVDAKWCTREEIKAILAHPDGARITRQEYKKFDEDEVKTDGQSSSSSANARKVENAPVSSQSQVQPPPFKVPPTTAIAGVLIRDWAEGRYGGDSAALTGVGQSRSSNL
ncbi:hypothetical protein SCHPADRAFT_902380 [Schizopora paradoxa]|uniref:NAD(+) diphosphatase n=1 Tax=Schizopora paradoxa TaxID=27342 RepID=A0A0H2RU17_9AGAM|nr:hypothetical protein SCHPADRAFT_902380 [Schizopora paradoxa]